MNAERLLVLYERVAEAPDAITRLRRFVLDLAVRGKLVPQDPNDEPASELLKRIEKEKARLARDGKFKTFEGNLDRSPSAFAFEIPQKWTWCYLDDIAAVARGGSPRPIEAFITEEPDGIPWIKIGDSQRGSVFIDETKERIKAEGLTKSRVVIPGDLLLSNSMSFGFPYITNIEGCIHDGWLVIRTPAGMLDKLYLHKVLLSGHAKAEFSEAAAGAVVQNLNADKARQLSVPLPPLAEQHRIVAKVDELMALCDRLEAARKDREAKRDRLSAASLARLNTPDPETFAADARFTLEALPALTTRPNQIKQLRQTILNLAVRGKLVPQDPNDEPALELLKRIAKEKARLVKAGEIRKEKTLPEVRVVDALFDLPVGWSWVRLGSATIIVQGFAFSSGDFATDPSVGLPLIKIGDIGGNAPEVFIKGTPDPAYLVKPGDILLGLSGSIKCSMWQGPEALLNQRIARIASPSKDLNSTWLLFGVNACIDKWKEETSKLTVQNIKAAQLNEAIIPLPPLAEQHRIVAKVDELMALCDRLEASLTTSDQTRTRLLDGLLAEALAPEAMQ